MYATLGVRYAEIDGRHRTACLCQKTGQGLYIYDSQSHYFIYHIFKAISPTLNGGIVLLYFVL